jgi:D-3-phosphoglycerate dehydrogenase
MKLLAISDRYIPSHFMEQGLAGLQPLGVQVEVRPWEHATLVDLQEANLVIEKDGPEAITLPAEVTREVAAFHVVVVQFAPLGRSFLEAAANLKVIGVLRGGTENVDVQTATDRGITIMNTPGRNARAVAECALGMILSEIRNIARSHACLKSGDWRRSFPNSEAIPELYEKTVGLIGYGAVGRLVAGYLHAFGSGVVAYDPFVQGDPSPATLVDLETLLRESDVVSIHARLTDETHHLVGERELALMKPTAVLVNTARSGLIDEEALVRALSERRIMGAALDVFDTEPLPADHPLTRLDNVTITPHLAGSTIDAFRNSPKLMAEHLTRLLQGEGDLPIVNGIRPTLRIS